MKFRSSNEECASRASSETKRGGDFSRDKEAWRWRLPHVPAIIPAHSQETQEIWVTQEIGIKVQGITGVAEDDMHTRIEKMNIYEARLDACVVQRQ